MANQSKKRKLVDQETFSIADSTQSSQLIDAITRLDNIIGEFKAKNIKLNPYKYPIPEISTYLISSSFFDFLPRELLNIIISLVDPTTKVQCVCKLWRRIVADQIKQNCIKAEEEIENLDEMSRKSMSLPKYDAWCFSEEITVIKRNILKKLEQPTKKGVLHAKYLKIKLLMDYYPNAKESIRASVELSNLVSKNNHFEAKIYLSYRKFYLNGWTSERLFVTTYDSVKKAKSVLKSAVKENATRTLKCIIDLNIQETEFFIKLIFLPLYLKGDKKRKLLVLKHKAYDGKINFIYLLAIHLQGSNRREDAIKMFEKGYKQGINASVKRDILIHRRICLNLANMYMNIEKPDYELALKYVLDPKLKHYERDPLMKEIQKKLAKAQNGITNV